jgi:hypothetical protein
MSDTTHTDGLRSDFLRGSAHQITLPLRVGTICKVTRRKKLDVYISYRRQVDFIRQLLTTSGSSLILLASPTLVLSTERSSGLGTTWNKYYPGSTCIATPAYSDGQESIFFC